MMLDRLIAPARAALNAMKDARMNATSDPLGAALFELDAIEEELSSLMKQDGFIDVFIEMMKNSR